MMQSDYWMLSYDDVMLSREGGRGGGPEAKVEGVSSSSHKGAEGESAAAAEPPSHDDMPSRGFEVHSLDL
jgi:hypothetical protein